LTFKVIFVSLFHAFISQYLLQQSSFFTSISPKGDRSLLKH
jgi:hypothetical protein